MPQTDCSWHIRYWQSAQGAWFAIAVRYADGITLFGSMTELKSWLVPPPASLGSMLVEWKAVSQHNVPGIPRAKLREELEKFECKECRCPGCTSRRYNAFQQKRLECR